MSVTAPRTLADQLRGWSDEQLAALLTARPDLAAPTPQDSAQLASRAATRASVLRAVDQLTVLELTVLDAIVALGGTASLASLLDHVHADPAAVGAAAGGLRAQALLWGPDDELRALSVVADIVGTTVSRLGPGAVELLAGYGPRRIGALARDLGVEPSGDRQRDVVAVAGVLGEQKQVAGLLEEVDARARAILEHLDREGKVGTVESADRPVDRGGSGSPVDQLLARGLLIARDARHVAVPREVAICLRGGRTTRDPADACPALATVERDPALVDRTAAGAAFELVRRVDLLLEHWGGTPPSVLRGGGLGVRDLRATAELLHLEERAAVVHIELAAVAGLLAVGQTEDHDSAWLPTDAFDVWNAGSVADRWVRLALSWIESRRLIGLVGGRDGSSTKSGKPVNALAPDLERGWLVETRRTMLEELAGVPAGRVLAPATGVPSLVDRLAWLRPRRPAARVQAVLWAVEEATIVGLVALGGLSAHGRALLDAPDPKRAGSRQPDPRRAGPKHAAAELLEPLLPSPVDHVLLQADLTAVAPGPLEQELAHNLATVADVESRGGATVYRFTEQSVRRAFDAGWSAAEVHEFVAGASRTPVPQPLVYLVDDVSRKFGTLRVGAAESFLRSDDEAALAELVHHPKAASLRLRRIAPTVVVSDVPVGVLLPRLRELGAAPVVEGPDGTVRLAHRESLRARTPKPQAPEAQAMARAVARVSATVTAIRAGDEAAASRPAHPEESRVTPTAALATLRAAIEAGRPVWIRYVDNHGSTVERVVEPRKVDAGWLTAYDRRAEDTRSFAVHRVTQVKPVG